MTRLSVYGAALAIFIAGKCTIPSALRQSRAARLLLIMSSFGDNLFRHHYHNQHQHNEKEAANVQDPMACAFG